jgi:hypothetical protein
MTIRKLVQTIAISALVIGPASTAHAQVSFGVRIGEPPAARAYRVPNRPGPDYEWVEGYWAPQGNKYVWHDGRWVRPPRRGAYWVEPYYYGGQYYRGQWWGGEQGRRNRNNGRR